MNRCNTLLLAAAIALPMSAGAAVIQITTDSLPAGSSKTWTADNTYVLNGFVSVKTGSQLTIEAGTVVKAKPGTGAAASALIVSRGAKLNARGRIDRPIIFTAEADNPAAPGSIGFDPSTTKGLWGGIILCGRAPNSVNGQVMQAEGVPSTLGDIIKYGDSTNALDQTTGLPTDSVSRARNTNDSSGVLQYVSIRYPGSILDANKEINGLTLCSVGKGTIIDHVEVFNSADDGVEWFGGTVDCKYLISAFSDDDAFDYDQGYSGKCQFLFALQNSENGRANRLGEFDSDDGATNAGAKPYAKPVWYNCTFIGSGKTSTNTLNDFALIYKENAGGSFVNSIVADFAGFAIKVEDKSGTEVDARARLAAGDIMIKNNIFYLLGKGDNTGGLSDSAYTREYCVANRDTVADPLLRGIGRTNNGSLDPRPGVGSPALAAAMVAPIPSGDKFFVTTSYLGAFDPYDLWIRGWTLLDRGGFVKPRGGKIKDIYADDIKAGQNYTWTSDTTYVLNGFVFVPAGTRLTLQPGTVVRGREGQGTSASALIVSRGGRIYANGTPTAPVIFTCMADSIDNPARLGFDPNSTKGMWGGLIICGRAPNSVNGQVMQAEGVPSTFGSAIRYGDSANALDQTTGIPVNAAAHAVNTRDTSGVLKYVSLRYAGSILDANKEINGLTLCSVGKGTEIHHVEIFNSADDGVEWFGGTVDCKYMISAFADDDAFDYDQGYNGKCQFLFALQNSENGRANRAGEFDSDDGASNAGAKPYAKPVWYNCTFIGSGMTSGNSLNDFALIYKENAGGKIANSIFTDFASYGVKVEDKSGTEVDARARLDAGDISLPNNLFFNLGKGNSVTGLSDSPYVRIHLATNNTTVENPQFKGISRTNNGQLIPQPMAGSPAWSNLAALPAGDAFFSATLHRGAFGNENWGEGWSMLSRAGIFGPFVAVKVLPGKTVALAQGIKLIAKNGHLSVSYTTPNRGDMQVSLHTVSGKLMSERHARGLAAGSHVVDLGKIPAGMYVVRLSGSLASVTRTIMMVQ